MLEKEIVMHSDSDSSRRRLLIALVAIMGGLLLGMAVGFLVDPGDTKRAMMARMW